MWSLGLHLWRLCEIFPLPKSIDLSIKSFLPCLSCLELLHLSLLSCQSSAWTQQIRFSSHSSHRVFAKKELLLLLLIRVEGSSWSLDTSIMLITNFGQTHQEVSSRNISMASQMQNLLSSSSLFQSAWWPVPSFSLFQTSQHFNFELSYLWFIHKPALFSTQGLFGSAKRGERNYFQHIQNSALGCHILKNSEHQEQVPLQYHLELGLLRVSAYRQHWMLRAHIWAEHKMGGREGAWLISSCLSPKALLWMSTKHGRFSSSRLCQCHVNC